jgi:hypothetical protein
VESAKEEKTTSPSPKKAKTLKSSGKSAFDIMMNPSKKKPTTSLTSKSSVFFPFVSSNLFPFF